MVKCKFKKRVMAGIVSMSLAVGVLSGNAISFIANSVTGSTASNIAKAAVTQGDASFGKVYKDVEFNDDGTFKGYVALPESEKITVYVNGGNVVTDAQAGTKTNYKVKTVYTDVKASNIFTKDKNGKVKAAAGKVVVGVVKGSFTDKMYDRGKIVDADGAKMAKATIKNGQITVTANKQAGDANLVVLDTGSMKYITSPVVVKAAPSALTVYKDKITKDGAFETEGTTAATAKKVSKINVPVSTTTTDVYLQPTYKDASNASQVAPDGTYTVTSANTDYLSVEADSTNPYLIKLTGKGLKDNKATSVKVTITCKENGKKTSFTANVTNPVTDVKYEAPTGSLTLDSGKANEFTLTGQVANEVKGSVKFKPTLSSSTITTTTDKVELVQLASATAKSEIKFDDKGKLTNAKASGTQVIKAKLTSTKDGIEISTAKGKVKNGDTAYFAVIYNTSANGYDVIKVTMKDSTPTPTATPGA